MAETFTIMIGGDIFPSAKNMDAFTQGAADQLYDEGILDLFAKADYRICNLEGAFTDRAEPVKKVDPVIVAPEAAAAGLKPLALNCVTLANNHIMDGGIRGYEDTCRTLDEAGIDYFGAGPGRGQIQKEKIIEAAGMKVGFYNVAETMFNIPQEEKPGANLYDEYRVCREIAELKERVDYLIVIYHGGSEFFWYNSEMARTRFHRMADNGADLVIAQHTHCVGICEDYQSAQLIYGQGDFLFARSVSEYKETGILIEVGLERADTETESAGAVNAQITRHLIRHEGGRVFLDPDQDMSAFDERSARFAAGETFDEEFGEYAQQKLTMFLQAFRGMNYKDALIRKIFGKERYAKYVRRHYNEHQILRMISALSFEEFNEIVTRGLWDLIR